MLLTRFKYLLAFLLLTCPLAFSQSTVVSFIVADSSGQLWRNGTINYVFQGNGQFGGQYQWQGANLPSQYLVPQTVTLDGSASGSVTVPSSNLITPANSSWAFTICPNASIQCQTVSVSVFGSTQNISSIITPVLPPISVGIQPIPIAYGDAEIKTIPAQGGFYFDSTLGYPKYWSGSAFVPLNGGGVPTGSVNILSCGVAGVGGDDTAVFNQCIDRANSINQPLYVPSGTYHLNNTRHAVNTALIGDGQGFTHFLTIGSFNGSSVIDGCDNGSAQCFKFSLSGFSVDCGGRGPAVRTGNPAEIGNTATGVLIGTQSNLPVVNDIQVEGCLYNIRSDNGNGTVTLNNVNAGGGWYGLYYFRDSGDLHITNSTFDGDLFAGIAAPGGHAAEPVYGGGFNGLYLKNVHLGHEPYCVYEEDGEGQVGIFGAIFDNVPCENYGNEMIHLPIRTGGGTRNSSNIIFDIPSASFSSDTSVSIQGNSSFPPNDYVISQFQNISLGGGSDSGNIVLIGGDFDNATTSGFVGLVGGANTISSIVTARPQDWNILSGPTSMPSTGFSSGLGAGLTSGGNNCLAFYDTQFTTKTACPDNTFVATHPFLIQTQDEHHSTALDVVFKGFGNGAELGATSGEVDGQLQAGDVYLSTLETSPFDKLDLIASGDDGYIKLLIGATHGGSTPHGLVLLKTGGSTTDPWNLAANSSVGGTANKICTYDGSTAINCPTAGSGLSVTITTAKLTTGGANGSMTFTNGLLTAQTPAN